MPQPHTSGRLKFGLGLPALWKGRSHRYGTHLLGRSESAERMIDRKATIDGKWKRRSTRRIEQLESIPGIKVCAIAASVALLLNSVLAIAAFSLGYSKPSEDGFLLVALYEGSCSVSKNWSTGLHLLINILGTVILSSGNYCAQFLAAPKREDIDRLHVAGSWLDIGIPSVRNIWALGKRQKAIWAILFMTTIPIHSLYNSVILTSRSSNAYNIYIAPAHYDGNRPLTLSQNSTSCFESQTSETLGAFNSDFNNANLKALTKEQCANTFSNSYLPGYGQLVILSSNLTWEDQDTMLSAGIGNAVDNYGALRMPAPYGWMCPDDFYSCSKTRVSSQLLDWKVAGAQWSKTIWSLTVASTNGTSISYVKNSLRRCPLDDMKNPLCIDLNTLFRFVWSGTPVTAEDIKSYLYSPGHWRNSTWAREVKYHEAEQYCDMVGETPNVLDKRYTVDGCLSVQVDEHCQLLFSPLFSLIVLICTMIKVACIVIVAYYDRVPRLLTVGDAIASFLTEPDRVTVGRCLASKADWKGRLGPWNGVSQHTLPRKLESRTRRWWQGPSLFQWTMTLFSCIGCIVCAAVLLNQGLSDSKLVDYSGTSASALWKLGLGEMNASTIIFRIDTTLLGNVLVANMPQIIISISYFYYNTVLTAMLMAAEYDGYAVAGTCDKITSEKRRHAPKKTLRVSGKLQGAQRSTYFLSLPYRYSIPLMVSYVVLHWLVSQSIFYVKVMMYDTAQKRVPGADVDACGWSPMALILAIAVGSLMVLALMVLGFRKFRSRIPLAGSCSAAISAACHPPPGDSSAPREAIIWGEIVSSESPVDRVDSGKKDVTVEVYRMNGDSDYQRGCFGHCSFTSYDVAQPSAGQIYL